MRPITRTSCTFCPLHASANSVCVPGDGPMDADILVVGEAPGAVEDRENKPFVGKSGKKLRATLKEVLGDEYKIRYTNTARCRPPDNTTPQAKEWKACAAAWLYPEIKAVRPKVIIAAGGTALRALTGRGSVLKAAGVPLQTDHGRVLPIYHPSYVLREPSREAAWIRHMYSVHSLMSDVEVPKVWKNYALLTEEEEIVARLTRLLEEGNPVGFDYETTGLNPWKDTVTSVAVAWAPGQARCFDPNTVKDAWKDFLVRAPLIPHNAAFEYAFSSRYFIRPGNIVWDTKLANQIKNVNSDSSLKYLACAHTDLGNYAQDIESATGEVDWENKTIEDLWSYNCADADATLRIANIQMRDEEIPHKLVKRSLRHTSLLDEVREQGILVDSERLPDAAAKVRERVGALSDEVRSSRSYHIFEEAEGREVPLGSPLLGKYIVEYLGARPLSYSRQTGKPQTNKVMLEANVDVHSNIQKILDWREADTLRKNFTDKLHLFLDDESRIHPQWIVGGTKTWRLASSSPNAQNVAKDKDLRRLYVAPPGFYILSADYSQAELRILAALAQEPVLLEAFAAGEDIHTRTAAEVFGVELNRVSTSMRSKGKGINFGIIYGITEHGLASKFNIPKDEGKELLERYLSALPKVKEWIEEQHEKVQDLGYVESPYGRRRHLPDARSEDKRLRERALKQASNMPIQSAAGELTLDAMLEVRGILQRPSAIIANVHDAIVCEIDRSQEDPAGLIVQAMENVPVPWEGVRLKVDVSTGDDWAGILDKEE